MKEKDQGEQAQCTQKKTEIVHTGRGCASQSVVNQASATFPSVVCTSQQSGEPHSQTPSLQLFARERHLQENRKTDSETAVIIEHLADVEFRTSSQMALKNYQPHFCRVKLGSSFQRFMRNVASSWESPTLGSQAKIFREYVSYLYFPHSIELYFNTYVHLQFFILKLLLSEKHMVAFFLLK